MGYLVLPTYQVILRIPMALVIIITTWPLLILCDLFKAIGKVADTLGGALMDTTEDWMSWIDELLGTK